MASGEEQEFVRRLEEQLRQLKVADVLAQTVVTISQLAWQRLAPDGRDLSQARLAIDALRALVPVLRGAIGSDLSRDLERGVSNLQLAYAQAAAEAASQATEPGAPGEAAAAAAGTDEPTGAGAQDAGGEAAVEGEAATAEAVTAAEPDAAAAGRDAEEEPLPGDEPPAEPVTES